jgi:hypothetical protein
MLLAATPADVHAGSASTLPAIASGCRNKRTTFSSLDSTILYSGCSLRDDRLSLDLERP